MRVIILLSAILVSALVASAQTNDVTPNQPFGRISSFLEGLRRRFYGFGRADESKTSIETEPMKTFSDKVDVEQEEPAIHGMEDRMRPMLIPGQEETIREQIPRPAIERLEEMQESFEKDQFDEPEPQAEPDEQLDSDDGSLIAHPPQEENLDHDQIIEALKDLRFNDEHQGEVAEFVAEQLYNAKDKENTFLVNGVAVDTLIEMNTVNNADVCTKRALRDRARIYEKTKPAKGNEVGVAYGVNVYALRVLRKTVDYCIEHQKDDVSKDLLTNGWINGLAQNVPTEGSTRLSSAAAIDEEAVHMAKPSDVSTWILEY